MQSFPEEATEIRARAQDERNRSRDATVTKLLLAQTAMRPNMARTGLSPSVMQAFEDEPDTVSEEHPKSERHAPARDGDYSNQHVVLLDPSSQGYGQDQLDREPFAPDTVHDNTIAHAWPASGVHRNRARHSELAQARKKAQGIILSLQDTMSTLEVLTQSPDR